MYIDCAIPKRQSFRGFRAFFFEKESPCGNLFRSRCGAFAQSYRSLFSSQPTHSLNRMWAQSVDLFETSREPECRTRESLFSMKAPRNHTQRPPTRRVTTPSRI